MKDDLWRPHPAMMSSGAAEWRPWWPDAGREAEQQLFVANGLLQNGLHPTSGFPDLRTNASLPLQEILFSTSHLLPS